MKSKKDPRLAEIAARHSNAASDMPVGAAPRTREKKQVRQKDPPPAIPQRSRFRWSNRPRMVDYVSGCVCGGAHRVYVLFFCQRDLQHT